MSESPTDDEFARHWLSFQDGEIDFSDDDEPLDDVLNGALAFAEAERALDVVINILDIISREGRDLREYAGILAAGLTEDVIRWHGEHVIERVEATAAVRSDFAWLLSGIWVDTTDEIGRRLRAVEVQHDEDVLEARYDDRRIRAHRIRVRAASTRLTR